MTERANDLPGEGDSGYQGRCDRRKRRVAEDGTVIGRARRLALRYWQCRSKQRTARSKKTADPLDWMSLNSALWPPRDGGREIVVCVEACCRARQSRD